jgi:hypothetical protein
LREAPLLPPLTELLLLPRLLLPLLTELLPPLLTVPPLLTLLPQVPCPLLLPLRLCLRK